MGAILAHPCRAYTWLALAFLLHTVEEVGGMADWLTARDLPILLTGPQVSRAAITLALIATAVMVVGRMGPWRPVQLFVALVAGMMLANVASHLGLSLATWSYMPGTGTALALLLPAGLWLFRKLPLTVPARVVAGGLGGVLMAPATWLALVLAA